MDRGVVVECGVFGDYCGGGVYDLYFDFESGWFWVEIVGWEVLGGWG